MKKKHRDIVVNGVQYGWTVWCNTVKLWKDKKVFAEFDIPYHHDITPKIVAGLIKDPELTMIWVEAKPCPFCGKTVEPVEHNDYFKCVHEEDCWFPTADNPISIISQSKLTYWNTRS